MRAHISPAWYTHLEQGRGGAASPQVLERLAVALELTEVEREHLFLLGLGRPAGLRRSAPSPVTDRLQRLLDRFGPCPALLRTSTWDPLAWNRAYALLFVDWSAVPPEERNLLRFIFLDPRARDGHLEWEPLAREVVAIFREESTRAGTGEEAAQLVEELSARSPEFSAFWRDNRVTGYAKSVKQLSHPRLGALSLENLVLTVDGRPGDTLIVYEFTAAQDEQKVRHLLAQEAVDLEH